MSMKEEQLSANPNIVRCQGCGSPVDARSPLVWQKVEGWERKREEGGTNHVALRKTRQEFMCGACIMKERAGVSSGQIGLL
jgi:hypothetical protein